ncbi:hypothetical protein [Aquisediminimonas profunda]|uniref:hypothetical protein n=1 Tax=Aquisediminimonas profunda TaxID=1550733 RepID=UPI001C624A95|nr:hypothetical protein [Aquisediminimonas profunda]
MSWSELYCRGVAPVQPTGWLFSCAAISRMICTFDEHQFAGQLRAFEAQFNAGNVSNVHPRPVRQNTLGSCAILDTPLAEVSEDEIDHRDHVAAPFEFVFHDVGQAVFDGRIGTAFRDKKGGELFLVPVAWWGIDDFWHRFATGGINPLQPYDCDAEQTH